MSGVEGKLAATLVTAATFHTSVMVAATTPDRKTRAVKKSESEEVSQNGGRDCLDSVVSSAGQTNSEDVERNEVINCITPRDEFSRENIDVNERNVNEESTKACKTIVNEENKLSIGTERIENVSCDDYYSHETRNHEIGRTGSGIEGRMAAALVTAVSSTTATVIACSSAMQNRTCKSHEMDNSSRDQSQISEGMVYVEQDDMSVLSNQSAEKEMAIDDICAASSETAIMLASVNKYEPSTQTESDGGSESHCQPETCSSVSSILPPLPNNVLFGNGCKSTEDQPESSRQSETTRNKFIAVDVITHPHGWLFHLIDKNSDASLSLEEFVTALADQPLVSMALNIPQHVKPGDNFRKIERVFNYMDYDGSGTINMKKFLTFIDGKRHAESLKHAKNMKKKLDALKDGARVTTSRPTSAQNAEAFKMDYLKSMNICRRLSLTSRALGDDDVNDIAENLKVNNFLRFLVLGRNNIGLEGVNKISSSLRMNTTLTRLDIGSNKFGNEGVIVLAEMLHYNSTLQRLDLYNTPMQESGARAIANCLRVNKTLRELSLRGNHMGNAGAILIGEALRYNTVLTSVFLQENDIDPIPGMRQFVTSLYSCDDFVLERLEGIDLAEFSWILDINPDPDLTNDDILSMMRKRRGLHVSKQIVNR